MKDGCSWRERLCEAYGGSRGLAKVLGVSVDLVGSWRQGRLAHWHWLDHVASAWERGWRPPVGLRRHAPGHPSVWGDFESVGFAGRRHRIGLSQAAVARMAGVSLARWRSWEQGRRRLPAYSWVLLSVVEFWASESASARTAAQR